MTLLKKRDHLTVKKINLLKLIYEGEVSPTRERAKVLRWSRKIFSEKIWFFWAILADAANTDLEIIIEYYFDLNKKTAKRYYKDIINRIKKLKTFPQLGRIVPECEDIFYDKYREIIYENFRIIYKIVENTIVVVRIIDGRRLLDVDLLE